MFLPWPAEKDIKVYPNETQQALATINRCLIRLLDNDKFLYNSITLNNGKVLSGDALESQNVKMSNAYLSVRTVGDPGNPNSPEVEYLIPLYSYDFS